MTYDMAIDEDWYEATGFVDTYPNVSRPGNKPYYYVDFPEKDVRAVFLCSYACQVDSTLGLYDKRLGFDTEQMAWLMTQALSGCEGKEVIIFSHKIPKSATEIKKFK